MEATYVARAEAGRDGAATPRWSRYSATTFPRDPFQGCERFIRMARAVGWIGEEYADCYGVLDVLDANADIVADFSIPTARAFQAIKKKLNIGGSA